MVINGILYTSTILFIWVGKALLPGSCSCCIVNELGRLRRSKVLLHEESSYPSQTACRAGLSNIDLTPCTISSINRTSQLHNTNEFSGSKIRTRFNHFNSYSVYHKLWHPKILNSSCRVFVYNNYGHSQAAIFVLHSVSGLVFIMGGNCCAVRTEFLIIMYVTFAYDLCSVKCV